jgi:hypothetical protein
MNIDNVYKPINKLCMNIVCKWKIIYLFTYLFTTDKLKNKIDENT